MPSVTFRSPAARANVTSSSPPLGRIRDQLAGKRIFITGTTGFLGTNLLERLLRTVPDCELVLLIRAGRRSTIQQRLQREVLRRRLRSLARRVGKDGFKEMTDARVTAVAGDVSRDGLGLDEDGRAALAFCDIVMHSAAAVSFDSPLDSAIEVNLLESHTIAETLHDLGVQPHFSSVSTCYVAGNRAGSHSPDPREREPVLRRRRLAGRGGGCQPARSDADAADLPDHLGAFQARRPPASSAPPPTPSCPKTERLLPHTLGQRPAGRGRHAAGGVAR